MPEYDVLQHFAQTYDLIMDYQKLHKKFTAEKGFSQWKIINKHSDYLNDSQQRRNNVEYYSKVLFFSYENLKIIGIITVYLVCLFP